jgi:phage host-nuclease inhibitor protein Gam
MDQQITKIRDKHADELAAIGLAKDAAYEVAQVYCAEQKDVLFVKKRSMETTHGVVGFRTGTPKLKTAKGFTWASVTNMLKEFLPAYVRTVDEPAKDKLLADRDNADVNAQFERVGILVDQDESFFIELKKEEAAVA